jgi:hypothetical protein
MAMDDVTKPAPPAPDARAPATKQDYEFHELATCGGIFSLIEGDEFDDLIDLPAGKDPKDFVIAANVQRRHLTTEQKRDLAIRLLRERPQDSDRKIALLIGVSNKTVSTHRNELAEELEKFVKAWKSLDATHRREFVMAHRHELRQAEGRLAEPPPI